MIITRTKKLTTKQIEYIISFYEDEKYNGLDTWTITNDKELDPIVDEDNSFPFLIFKNNQYFDAITTNFAIDILMQ